MHLYIHVPFCRRKCHYCAFSSQAHTSELEKSYLEALDIEAGIRAKQIRGKRISSIYLGGGTPTLLTLSSLARIIDIAASSFSMDSGIEFTIEANPETIPDKNFPADLKKLGINRLSLGVQSLDDGILTRLGRSHTPSQALRAADIVLEAGIDNLSIDLIWGLPGQTLKRWLQDLKTVISHGPQHVSCYGLTLEPGTFFARLVEEKEIELPDENLQARMYLCGSEYLESKGILQYEVSNFAKKDYLCSHNIGYWEGNEFLGLGPSAVSSFNGLRWMNPSNIEDYAGLANKGFKGLCLENINGSKLINEKIMLALRTSRGLRLGEYSQLTGQNFFLTFNSLISVLQKNNLVRLDDGHLCLTRKGMLVSNSIIERFIS